MNCEHFSEVLIDYLVDRAALDDAVSEEFQAHVSSCAGCAAELYEMRESLAVIGTGEPFIDQDVSGFAEGVMSRIREPSARQQLSSADATGEAALSRLPMEASRFWSYALAAGILIVFLAGQWWYLQRIASLANATRDPAMENRVAELEQAIAEMRALGGKSGEQKIHLVSFSPLDQETAKIVRVHAVWDEMVGELHFFGFDFPQLQANQTYAMWFRSDNGSATLATDFRTDKSGTAALVVPLPDVFKEKLPDETIISIESIPVGDQPGGKVWLKSRMQ